MSTKRKRHSPKFKFQVALEAAKETKTVNQLASEHGLHPSQISQWKGQLLNNGATIFSTVAARQQREQESLQAELYEQIGRLKMELEWLKKKLPDSIEAKRAMIETDHLALSIRRQCELVGLNRSTFYYTPAQETELNLLLMNLIDKQYTKTPFYGWPRMTAVLRRQGYPINHKRVRRLMQKTGLQAVYPKRRTTVPAEGHKIYPYLLRNLAITHPNQVWSADITYIAMLRGFMYLVENLEPGKSNGRCSDQDRLGVPKRTHHVHCAQAQVSERRTIASSSFSPCCALSSATDWQDCPAGGGEPGMGLSFSQLASSGVVLDRHLSVRAAAESSGCNEQYLRRLLRAGRFQGVKIGQVWLIRLASLDARWSLTIRRAATDGLAQTRFPSRFLRDPRRQLDPWTGQPKMPELSVPVCSLVVENNLWLSDPPLEDRWMVWFSDGRIMRDSDAVEWHM